MTTVVTLLTDFGLRDPYVGLMKVAILRAAPRARLLDLTHEIPRHNVETASFWLDRCLSWCALGTIHLAVVDPGVGSERGAVAVRALDQVFVCPDNGLLSDVLRRVARTPGADCQVVKLERSRLGPSCRRVGTTFDGRDLFSPVAGLLAAGRTLETLGTLISPDELVRLDIGSDEGTARVRVRDHYGNLITDAPAPTNREVDVVVDGVPLPWKTTYAEGEPGQAIALSGSLGTIEIAVNQGSAADTLSADIGSLFQLRQRV